MLTHRMDIPRATDRAAWEGLLPAHRDELLAAGRALLGKDYPPVTATQYLAYRRDGSREAMQVPYFARRAQLLRLALAECADGNGAYLDDITDGIWCICEESTWCVSAHNNGDDPLMDVDDPYIDLFAAQTASLLSWVCYLLETALLPAAVRRVRREVQQRLLTPFYTRDDFWWMGVVRKDLNNWTPWILANTLQSARIWGQDVSERALPMLHRWLACIPEDGGLDEGVAYWNMAGGSLLDCMEQMSLAWYNEPKIRALAAFPLRTHIAGDWFVNFADCDAKPYLDGERLYAFGQRVDNPALCALGAAVEARMPSIFPGDTPETYRTLRRLFYPVPASVPCDAPARDATYPELGLWIREREGVYIACKAGHNAESHNHNDVGSFIVYVDGEPAVVDVGNMVYTAKTFRDETRYDLWNTRSRNHNVPLIGGHEQAAGRAYHAVDVALLPDEASMDIAPAYPDAAQVRSLRRTFALDGSALLLRDQVSLGAAQAVEWVFMLRHSPEILPGRVRAGAVQITHDPALTAHCEAHEVTDARMRRSFPGTLYRLVLCAAAAVEHDQSFRIQRCV